MRRGYAGLWLVALLIGAAACAPAPAPAPPGASAPAASPPPAGAAVTPEPVVVRYGISATSLNFLPSRMAVEQGFYRRYGLDVEVVQVGAGVMAAAQLAGELEYTTAYPGAIRSAAQGAPLRIVSTVVGAPLFVMLGRPEVGSLADLRGQPVGITTRGGAIEKVTRDLLALAGLEPDADVTILPAGAQTPLLVEALVSGRVKAAALSPPWFIRARNQGMRMLANAAELVREPQNGLVVTEERLNRQRDQVRHVIQAEIESIRFMRQNRAASVALSREWLAISPEEAEESYDFVMPAFVADGQVDVAGLERYIAVDKAEGTVPPTFQLDQIIETGIAPEAVRALDARR